MDLMQLTIGHHRRCRTLTDWTEINRINYNICEYDNQLGASHYRPSFTPVY